MITTLNIPGGISPIPNAYVGFLSDTAITVLSKIMEAWYESQDNNTWMKISSSKIADSLAKSKNSISAKVDELVSLGIIESKSANGRAKLFRVNWKEIAFDSELISSLDQSGKNQLWNACYANSDGITPISSIEESVIAQILDQYSKPSQFLNNTQENLLKICAIGYKATQNLGWFSKTCANFESVPNEPSQILSRLYTPLSDEATQNLRWFTKTIPKNESVPNEPSQILSRLDKTIPNFESVTENGTQKSGDFIVKWSKNDTTINIHVSEALQDALFDIGLDNVRIKLRSDAGCIAVFQQKKEKQEEQDGKETKKEKNLPPYPYLIKEINKEKGEQEEKKEKKLMASAARPNKGGKDENVLENDSFLDSGLDSFLEGRSNEQPSRVFSVLRSWAEDRSCEGFEYLPGYELNNILNDPELYDSDYDIVLRNTWNDIQGLYRDSVEDSPGSEKILVPVQIFKTMLYRVLEEQYEINSQFKVTEQDAKNIFGFELTEQDGEPYYIIDPDEIRDINKPIVIKPQLKSRNVFDHASERVKKLVYSECMAEVPEQDFTRAEKAIRYMTNYVEERARNKTPRAEEMTPMQFPSFLESVSKYSNLSVDDLKILFSRLQKKKRVGLFYLKFNLLVIEEIIQFNHDRNEYGKVEELYCKKMAEREG
jgi:hypothetical protein